MLTILLLGCNGQVGWELQRSLSVLGEVVALGSAPATSTDGPCGEQSHHLLHTFYTPRGKYIA